MTHQDDELDRMQPHPCETPGCLNTVQFDDEPHCFAHSPDSGSHVPGYSWQAKHRQRRRWPNC